MRRPDLRTVVSVGEIVSALAVVATLLYVANGYRRSQALTNQDVEDMLYARMLERDRLVIENADFAAVLLKAIEHPDSLSEAERLRYLAYEHIFFDSWESAWNYHQEGILEPANWASWSDWFSQVMSRTWCKNR